MKPTNFWTDKIRWQVPGEPSGGAPADPPADAAPDYSWIPADYQVDGKPDFAKFSEHYKDLTRAPEVPEAYDFAPPADLKFDGLPEGFKIEIDAKDPTMAPLFDELGAMLKGMNAPADAGQKVSGLLAKYEAAKYAEAVAAQTKEMESLGPQATARIEAVQRAMEAALPADQVAALKGVTMSAKALMAIEKLLSPRSLASPPPSPASVADDLKSYYQNPTR